MYIFLPCKCPLIRRRFGLSDVVSGVSLEIIPNLLSWQIFLTLMRFASVCQDTHFIISTQTKWLNSRNSSSWFCSLCMLRFENQKASLSLCCFDFSLLILIWLLVLFVCYALIHHKILSENPPLITTVSLNNGVCRF